MVEIGDAGDDMGELVVVNHLSLDGVMQAPGRPDEDTRDGFAHGGWAISRSDALMATTIGERMGEGHAFLFGRRSYEDMLAVWNERGGPYGDALNNTVKYVASGSPATTLDWPNSRLLQGHIPGLVAALKKDTEGNLVIMGSGQLIRSLLPHRLIDVFTLMIHPLVLGAGQRLFDHAERSVELELTDSVPTSTGVIIATYRSVRGLT